MTEHSPTPPSSNSSVHPFIWVAATRYAIGRILTVASRLVAYEVAAHADLIRQDPSATMAILHEIEDWLGRVHSDQVATDDDRIRARAAWMAARLALTEETPR